MLLLPISSILIATIQAQPPITSSQCIAAYGQCGGTIAGNLPYTGETCCIPGYTCTVISSKYSQCNPTSNTPQTPTNPSPPSNPNTQIVTPVNPTDPQRPVRPNTPITPQQPPATPVTPQQPPATPITPVTPQQPPATPQYPQTQTQPQAPVTPQYPGYGYGYQPQPGYGYGPYGGFMPGVLDGQYLDCEYGQCVNRKIELTPAQGFVLNCKFSGQCNGLDLTLNVGQDPTNWGSGVSEINDLNFDAPQSGVTITINSVFAGNIVEVNNIYCKVAGACTNLKVTTGYGVDAWNMGIKCVKPGSCNGCTINGESCEYLSMMQGSNGYMPNNMYNPYGYGGYTNTPNQPQAGAPGVSQQGMP